MTLYPLPKNQYPKTQNLRPETCPETFPETFPKLFPIRATLAKRNPHLQPGEDLGEICPGSRLGYELGGGNYLLPAPTIHIATITTTPIAR